MSDDFDDVLNTPVDELPDELQVPPGVWLWHCRAVTPKKSPEGELDNVLFALEPKEGLDVDPDDLAEFEEASDGEETVMFHRLRQGSPRQIANQVKSLCKILGVKSAAEIKDMLLVAKLSYDPNKKDPDRPWARFSGFMTQEAYETQETEV